MDRRALLLGLGTILAAPAIVKADGLMRIAKLRESISPSPVKFDGEVYYLAGNGFYRYSPFDGLVALSAPVAWRFTDFTSPTKLQP